MRPYPRPSPRAPGSAALWLHHVSRSTARWGTDHPATQAALGRFYALTKGPAAVPQRNAKSPAAIAWHRASEAQPGYLNRTARRHLHQ